MYSGRRRFFSSILIYNFVLKKIVVSSQRIWASAKFILLAKIRVFHVQNNIKWKVGKWYKKWTRSKEQGCHFYCLFILFYLFIQLFYNSIQHIFMSYTCMETSAFHLQSLHTLSPNEVNWSSSYYDPLSCSIIDKAYVLYYYIEFRICQQ